MKTNPRLILRQQAANLKARPPISYFADEIRAGLADNLTYPEIGRRIGYGRESVRAAVVRWGLVDTREHRSVTLWRNRRSIWANAGLHNKVRFNTLGRTK